MQQPDSIAGRYRIVRPIGRGGMGTVWLCTDETLHREVAIKEIGSLPGESPSDTARAMREARLTAALNHKNAVSIYDVVEHAGRTWLVMEYVPSQTLSQLLASAGRLPPDRVAHIGAQVAAALSTAHSRGIVHRDIKPGNILVGDEDVAMISDFGIARGHQDAHLTQTGLVTGTPAFFSPELARGEEPTYSSDVWALGITLYTATEGGPPYEHQSNPLAMLSAITQEPLPAPTHAGPLTGVLAGMLETDPSQRLTMAQSLAALRRAEQETKATRSSEAPTVAANSPATTHEPRDQTSVIPPPVEPAYERSVPLPVLSSGPPLAPVSHELPPRGDRSPFGRLAIGALALLVVLGAGALLWRTVGFGTDDGAGATPSDGSGPVGPKSKADRSGKDPTTDSTEDSGASNKAPKSEDPTTSKEPPSSDEPPTTEAPTTEAPTSADPTTEAATSAGPTTDPPDEPPAASPVAFTQSYFNTVPGNVDAGWSLIAPSMQAAIGRSSYDNFWSSIDSVELGSVDPIGDRTVRYQITYNLVDGSQSPETKQLTLQPSNGSYLITSDSPAG